MGRDVSVMKTPILSVSEVDSLYWLARSPGPPSPGTRRLVEVGLAECEPDSPRIRITPRGRAALDARIGRDQ